MAFFFVAYIIVGVVVYAVTDTTGFASRISRTLVVVPYGAIQSNLFLFVVGLWPVWLFFRARRNS